MTLDSTSVLIRRAINADAAAVGELFNRNRLRLRRFVDLRLDDRVRGRIDPSDVVQDACIEGTRRLDEYFLLTQMPFYVWLRLITAQKLALAHRHHLRVLARNAARDVPLFAANLPDASSALLAARLLGRSATPCQAALRAEQQLRLQGALESLRPHDREIIVLRHFEQLSNLETASVLGLSETTASTRHVRALQRLRKILDADPNFRDLL
ncbi:MAG: sigma-70 family RNA polymerase sigma factor [Planctomycetales bacterium]|nr:sigma-70 family RNA polymerase sigma factor [Planctomycetales bacterium]MCA9166071.1 sigma-70 family RNA polymerase sigma factor [Planctomycetales bacterium]